MFDVCARIGEEKLRIMETCGMYAKYALRDQAKNNFPKYTSHKCKVRKHLTEEVSYPAFTRGRLSNCRHFLSFSSPVRPGRVTPANEYSRIPDRSRSTKV